MRNLPPVGDRHVIRDRDGIFDGKFPGLTPWMREMGDEIADMGATRTTVDPTGSA
jgi:hypothetical protein